MLKVTIELWPRGDQEKARVLGVMQIAQIDCEGGLADYKVVADENPNEITAQPFATFAGRVINHKREQSVYGLVAKAARAAASSLNRKADRRR